MLRCSVSELDESASVAAWPLVRLAHPELDAESWRQSARALQLRGGGVLGLEVENSGVMGIATFEAVDEPRFGRILQVSTIVTAELSRKAPFRRLLMRRLKEVAAALHCSDVLVTVSKRPPPKRSGKQPLSGTAAGSRRRG